MDAGENAKEANEAKSTQDLEGEDSLEAGLLEYSREFSVADVRIEKGRMSLFEIKRRTEKGDIQLDPDFQRGNVWKAHQKSELVESILMGIPLPLFYFFEDRNARIQIVDGK